MLVTNNWNAYIAEIVGIASGLLELRDVRWQGIFLMDRLQVFLVEQLWENTHRQREITGSQR